MEDVKYADYGLSSRCTCGSCGAPKFVCFAGKRQWMELLNTGKKGKEKLTKIEQGLQALRPQVRPYKRPAAIRRGYMIAICAVYCVASFLKAAPLSAAIY